MTPITRRRLLATAGHAPLLAAAPAWAQRDLPADARMDEVYSAIIQTAWAVPLLGPFIAPIYEAQRAFAQSALWNYRLVADDALMTAWTTQSFAQLDREVRSAVAAGRWVIDKLQSDVAWYAQEYSRITAPNFRASSTIEEEAAAKYNRLRALIGEIQPPLAQAGQALVAKFDEVRARVLGSGRYAPAERVRWSGEIGGLLVAYRRAAEAAEQKVDAAVDPGEELTIGGRRRRVVLTPRRQVKLRFANDSETLVFFARLWTRQPDGSYQLRPDTESWVTIYPRGAAATVARDSDPTSPQAAEMQLANEVWLPARAWDRLELRVATYGEHRKRIRWQVIRGNQVRPELTSLRRGFYWLGYEVRRSESDRIISRWFPIAESYTWQFRGLWEGGGELGPQWARTDVATLREELPNQLALERDHLTWNLPSGLPTISSSPTLEAQVEGTATIQRIGPTSGRRSELTESGRGRLLVEMSLW